jgi:hypothetical protein
MVSMNGILKPSPGRDADQLAVTQDHAALALIDRVPAAEHDRETDQDDNADAKQNGDPVEPTAAASSGGRRRHLRKHLVHDRDLPPCWLCARQIARRAPDRADTDPWCGSQAGAARFTTRAWPTSDWQDSAKLARHKRVPVCS